jgi:hypothetical protein
MRMCIPCSINTPSENKSSNLDECYDSPCFRGLRCPTMRDFQSFGCKGLRHSKRWCKYKETR